MRRLLGNVNILGTVIVVGVVILLGIGAVLGDVIAKRVAAIGDARETKILSWIVERNPNATIKEFSGFSRILLREASTAGVDYRLVMALIDKESQFNPRAIGSSGEVGLMQILPATASIMATGLGLKFDAPVRNRSGSGPSYSSLGTLGEPGLNVRIGLAYLKDQMKRFEDAPTALRAYNRGDANATAHRPHDRYAEDIGLRLVALVQRFPR